MPFDRSSSSRRRRALVHLASGIGNIVLATPLLVALDAIGLEVEVLVDGDYRETADLLGDWAVCRRVHRSGISVVAPASYDVVVPAIPPFYWSRYARHYRGVRNALARPPDALFYRDEQEYYLRFAHLLGYAEGPSPWYRLPIPPDPSRGVGPQTLVLAPGSKSGEMATKRW